MVALFLKYCAISGIYTHGSEFQISAGRQKSYCLCGVPSAQRLSARRLSSVAMEMERDDHPGMMSSNRWPTPPGPDPKTEMGMQHNLSQQSDYHQIGYTK